jgi:hypothetical protein
MVPLQISWAVFTLLSLVALLIAFYRMGLAPRQVGLVALSPFFLYNLWHGNLDSFVLLGSVLSPAAGIWLLLLKPQLTWPLIALWLLRCRKDLRARSSITFLLSFFVAGVVAGFATLPHLPHPEAMPWNTSLWPSASRWGYSLLFVPLDDIRAGAAPLLTPYVALLLLLSTLPLSAARFLAAFVALAWAAW